MDDIELEIELAQRVADIHGALLNVKMAAEKYREGKGKVEEFINFLSGYEQKINALNTFIEKSSRQIKNKKVFKSIVSKNRKLFGKIKNGSRLDRIKKWNHAEETTDEDRIKYALKYMDGINEMTGKLEELGRKDIGDRV